MKADFVAYGFEQLNEIRDAVIEAEGDGDSQEELLFMLKTMFVDMTNEEDKEINVSKFVTSLFVSAMKVAYQYFEQEENIGVKECAEIFSQMAVYAKDLSFNIKDDEIRKTFYASSFVTKSFIAELMKSAKPSNILKLDHPLFATDYNIEEGNLADIIDWL